MKAEASFQQILERKIRQNIAPTPSESGCQQGFEHPATPLDPAHLAYLLGTQGSTLFRPSPQRAYPSRPKPATPPPPPHSLTEGQLEAVRFFQDQGRPLSPAFSQRELKKSFRHLALKLHPDMNKGASEGAFRELKSCFEVLNGLFD